MDKKTKRPGAEIRKLLKELEDEPWDLKIKRWFRLKYWHYYCMSRRFWDKSFEGYIFKKKSK